MMMATATQRFVLELKLALGLQETSTVYPRSLKNFGPYHYSYIRSILQRPPNYSVKQELEVLIVIRKEGVSIHLLHSFGL